MTFLPMMMYHIQFIFDQLVLLHIIMCIEKRDRLWTGKQFHTIFNNLILSFILISFYRVCGRCSFRYDPFFRTSIRFSSIRSLVSGQINEMRPKRNGKNGTTFTIIIFIFIGFMWLLYKRASYQYLMLLRAISGNAIHFTISALSLSLNPNLSFYLPQCNAMQCIHFATIERTVCFTKLPWYAANNARHYCHIYYLIMMMIMIFL